MALPIPPEGVITHEAFSVAADGSDVDALPDVSTISGLSVVLTPSVKSYQWIDGGVSRTFQPQPLTVSYDQTTGHLGRILTDGTISPDPLVVPATEGTGIAPTWQYSVKFVKALEPKGADNEYFGRTVPITVPEDGTVDLSNALLNAATGKPAALFADLTAAAAEVITVRDDAIVDMTALRDETAERVDFLAAPADTQVAAYINTAGNTARIAVDNRITASIAPLAGPSTTRYGVLTMPAGFPTLPATFYRDNDGVIRHTYDFTTHYPATATKIYVATAGNDTTGTGAVGTPYRTLVKAMAVANAGAATHYEIIITDITEFRRDEAGFNGTITGKTIAIRSQVAKRTRITANAPYTWTADGAGTYTTARSGVTGVLDSGRPDHHGLPVVLRRVDTIADCQASPGTWHTNGTAIWVHRADNTAPTADTTIVTIGVLAFDPILTGGAVLYTEGIIFCGWSSGNGLRVRGNTAGTAETYVARNCGYVGTTGNGYMTSAVARTFLFNCQTAYQQLDGFNYTYDGMTWATARANTLAVEYQCTAYQLGVGYPGGLSNNSTTCHGGANILRIGHVGYENTGATIIDVNGCRSVLYDCHARTPIDAAGVYGNGTTYLFSADSPAAPGVAYLYDSTADDCTTALTVGSNTTAYVGRFRRPTTAAVTGAGTINYV